MLVDLVLTHSLGFNPVILNYSSWSISVEFYTYILFALLVIGIRRFNVRLGAFLVLAAGGAVLLSLLNTDLTRPLYATSDFGLLRCF